MHLHITWGTLDFCSFKLCSLSDVAFAPPNSSGVLIDLYVTCIVLHWCESYTVVFLSEFFSRDEGHGENELVMSTCCAGRLSRLLFTEHY